MIKKWIKQLFCHHDYYVVGTENWAQLRDEKYYLPGSEWWRGSKGIIYREKFCLRCGKTGIHESCFFT